MKFGCNKHRGVILRSHPDNEGATVFRYEMNDVSRKAKNNAAAKTAVDFPGEALASLSCNCDIFSDWMQEVAGD